ncbi:uncharacterized protein LOC143922314 [Arctopsyche grandis]|uniref:uncharacterized protein LOC143922314 n=1 Tax=Arctopsyche grandis TaxID=121162 RepID=UPI00406D8E65
MAVEMLAMISSEDIITFSSPNKDPMREPGQIEQLIVQHPETDQMLLDTLDCSVDHPVHVGRFLTLNKRRKERLRTKTLRQDVALLDDFHNGQVKCILEQSVQWRFNAFTLENVSGGRCITSLCLHLFRYYGLLNHFQLDVTSVWKLFMLIEEGYHSANPYHNSIHAADVTQAMHCFLQQKKIRDHLEPIEIMASLIGAVAHDMEHPGVNQSFMISTSNHLSALYNNTSVLENHHWRSGIGCVIESGIAAQMANLWPRLRDQINSLILATDITRQQEFLALFKQSVGTPSFDLHKREDRHFVLQIALKCADISNPCRPWDLSRKWSMKVCEEFFRQGDHERNLQLPITSMCDRTTTSIPKIQAGFLKFVVTPLVSEWHNFLMSDLTQEMIYNLDFNQKKWESMVVQESIERKRIEAAEEKSLEDMEAESAELSTLLPNAETTTAPSVNVIKCEDNRGYYVPFDLEPQAPIDPSRRKSFDISKLSTFDEIATTDEEKLGFKDSQFLFYSAISLNRTIKEPKVKRVVIAESLLPQFSIASITNTNERSRISLVLNENEPITLIRQQPRPPVRETSTLSTYNNFGDSLNSGSISSFLYSSENTELQVTLSQSLDMRGPSMGAPCLAGVDSFQEHDEDDWQNFDYTDIASEWTENSDSTYIEFGKEKGDSLIGTLHLNRRSSAPSTSNASEIPRLAMRRCSAPVESHGDSIEKSKKRIYEDQKKLSKKCHVCNMEETGSDSFSLDSNFVRKSSFSKNRNNLKYINKKISLQRRHSIGAELIPSDSDVDDNNRLPNWSVMSNLRNVSHLDIRHYGSLPLEALTETEILSPPSAKFGPGPTRI